MTNLRFRYIYKYIYVWWHVKHKLDLLLKTQTNKQIYTISFNSPTYGFNLNGIK